MQKYIISFLLFISLSATPYSLLAQGPLDGYFKGHRVLDMVVSGGFQTANKYYGGNKTFDYARTLGMAGFFVEYGVKERFDLVATLPYIGDKLQDVGVYAKFKMIDTRISSRPFVLVPGFGFSTPASKYTTESLTSIGQAATQFHGHLIAQTTLFGKFSLQAQGAYHYAIEPVPSNVTASAKLIYSNQGWYVDGWYEFQEGLGNLSYQVPQVAKSFREFSVNHHKIGGVVYKGFKSNWGMFVNGSTVLGGRNTFNTTVVMVGFNKKINFLERQIARYNKEQANQTRSKI